jgi:curved DNA-binding protein CbpA
MALAHHYRILGLRTGASFDHVKLAYRNLARLYHPDVNPGDQLAKEKFIQITQAYQALAKARPQAVVAARSAAAPGSSSAAPRRAAAVTPPLEATPGPAVAPPAPVAPEPKIQQPPGGSEADQTLKQSSFKQLQDLFRNQRYPRAVALVEGLAHRFPNDPEVRQWQAITYYRWGHDALNGGHLNKAAACLKKAWRVDPHNKSLQQALQQDLQRLEQMRQSPVQAQVQEHLRPIPLAQ